MTQVELIAKVVQKMRFNKKREKEKKYVRV